MLSFIIKSLIRISNFVTDYFLYLVFSLNIFNELILSSQRIRAVIYIKKTEKISTLISLDRQLTAVVLVSSSKKEVFQPHLPVRLPCYDLAPVTIFAFARSLRAQASGANDFHGLTGGVYKARERIHRAMADARLLANPASWSRVADSSPN